MPLPDVPAQAVETATGATGADAPRNRTLMDIKFPTGLEADATGPTSSMSLEIVQTMDDVPSRAVHVGD